MCDNVYSTNCKNSFSKNVKNQLLLQKTGFFYGFFSKNFLLSAILRIQENFSTKFSKTRLNFEQLIKKLHQDWTSRYEMAAVSFDTNYT
jgi:hypothetical protein